MRDRRVRTVLLLTLVLVVGVVVGVRSCAAPGPVLVVATGNLACDPTDPAYGRGRGVDGPGSHDECRARAVSDLAVGLHPQAMLGLGDYQYELPTARAYRTAYDASWGRLRDVTIPAVGNQEYKVHDANTFRSYFGDGAGADTGYWSTDLGAWHVVVLDSNCTTVFGGCGQGSVQQEWLAADLAAHEGACTVALMHHPRWSSGIAGDNQTVDDLWRTLAGGGADLLLTGHEKDYERFPAMTVDGDPDPHGLTEIVSGVGGQAHYRPALGGAGWRRRQVAHPSTFVDHDHLGFVSLRLGAGHWSEEYHALGPHDRDVVLDRSTGTCG